MVAIFIGYYAEMFKSVTLFSHTGDFLLQAGQRIEKESV